MAENITLAECKERVALDLMKIINNHAAANEEHRSKDYWYKLYAECHALVVNGWGPSDAKKVV